MSSTFTPSDRQLATGIALFLLALALLALGSLFIALPWFAGQAASRVPASWETDLGTSVASMVPPDPDAAAVEPRLNTLLDRLGSALPTPPPYNFTVRAADCPEVNAFAAPGGFLFVCRGLLKALPKDDEIAAVLAHEMQHVLHRHSTRAIFRALALQSLAAVALGDVTSFSAQAATLLGGLRYQRADELEADRDGLDLLRRAGFDPSAMARMLQALDLSTQDKAAPPAWLSTHPDTKERIRAAENAAR